MSYEFTIGKHAQQAHDYVSALIDGAYSRKNAGNPTTPSERVNSAQSICESYYDQVGQQPPSAVLSRLAWYIDFDHMTDSHPDKMTREELPVMSAWQELVRGDKQISLKNVDYGDRRGNGRRKTAFTGKGGYVGVSNNKMPDRDDDSLVDAVMRVDVAKLISDACLTDRQRQVIDLIYQGNETQADVGLRLNISQQAVAKHHDAALRKLRDTATKGGRVPSYEIF